VERTGCYGQEDRPADTPNRSRDRRAAFARPAKSGVARGRYQISATPFETKAPLPSPSKGSPIAAKAPEQAQQLPETASKDSGKATPASVISLSDTQLQEGTATLPLINEVAPATFSGSLSAGRLKGLSQTGQGKADGKQNGAGAGQAPAMQMAGGASRADRPA